MLMKLLRLPFLSFLLFSCNVDQPKKPEKALVDTAFPAKKTEKDFSWLEIDHFKERSEKQVLAAKRVSVEYSFQHSEELIEYHITYLGQINSSLGIIYFLNNVTLFGRADSKRANGKVILYSDRKKRIGHYYVGGVDGIATRIDGDNLIFHYENTCDQKTMINFKDSIPCQIRCMYNKWR